MDKIFVVQKNVTIDYETTAILCPVFFRTLEEAENYIEHRIIEQIQECGEEAKCEVYNNGHTLRTVCLGSFESYYEYWIEELFDGATVYKSACREVNENV